MADEDVGDLWADAPAGAGLPVTHRQGTILAFDQSTGANTVKVGQATVTDVPLLGVAEAATLTVGAEVGIMSTGRQMYIVGRIVTPLTGGYTDAVNRLSNSIQSDTVVTGQATSSTSYVDLGTVGPSVRPIVKSSGRLLLIISANIRAFDSTPPSGGWMTAEIRDAAGAAVYAAGDLDAYGFDYTDDASHLIGDDIAAARVLLVENLTPGTYTVTAKYSAGSGGNSASFANRNITTISI